MASNAIKLKALCDVFDISIQAVATICKVSRPLVSRILSETDEIQGSSGFWIKVERSLPAIIEQRKSQMFEIEAVPFDKVNRLRDS